MSTTDRPDGPLASWRPEPPPPAPYYGEGYDPAGAPPEPARKFSARVVARAIRRNWWQILLIWSIASVALVTLVYLRVKPTYEAVAYVLIEPPSNNSPLLGVANSNSNIESQLETQAQRMLTSDILGMALKDPKVAGLPRIATALDPEALVRKELRVEVKRGTRFITVALTSQTSAEAVAIVNAVALAYNTSVENLANADSLKQTKRLKRFLDELDKQVEEKKATLTEMVNRIDGPAAADPQDEAGGPNALEKLREKESITFEEFKANSAQLSALELDLMDAEKRLDRMKVLRRQSMESIKVDKAVDQEVQANTEVNRLRDEYERALQQFERAQGMVKPTDIALIAARKRMNLFREKYQAKVTQLRPIFRQKLEGAMAGSGEREIREAEDHVVSLQTRREGLEKKMKAMKVEINKNRRVLQKDSLALELARSDYNYSLNLRDKVKQQYDAKLIDIENEGNKVYLTLAQVSFMPTTNSRTKLMAAAPAGTLAVVLALFVMLEMGAGRVADPDDLAGRLNLGVIGVVPPLPGAESARGALPWGNGPERAKRRVEEFVQSLDHLRVQLWAGRRPGAHHRVVLITSACVSEGKTTLSAQLAGRCANAGMSTLLIDADLRRPALAKLLEVPSAPGLADVLAGEVEPEGAMIVIGNAGGFHLMPAGRRGQDPGRLLEGPRLGELLARLRETFDMIIVDAPPILPVPDALILGRHTDGAVLAVRHDSSRYPLVERAKQKLASVGVPILGAVVNGVKGGSSYGNYAYSSTPADRDGLS
jgi:succinoglycan biosynthesis transport protein ExoP